MSEDRCDNAFIEEVENRWEFQHTIDVYTFPRLLSLAKRGVQSRSEVFNSMGFGEIQTTANAMLNRDIPMRIDVVTMLIVNLAARMKEKE